MNMFHLLSDFCKIPANPSNTARNFELDFTDEIQMKMCVINDRQNVFKPPGQPAQAQPQPQPQQQAKP